MISAVVLAAGRSSRMGRPKLVLKLDGRPILKAVLDVLGQTKVDEVVVVLGADAARIRKEVRFGRERVVMNEDSAGGMSSSLRLGLKSISPKSEGILVVLGDQPLVSPATIDKLVDVFAEEDPPVVLPVHDGARGNPVLFARRVFPEVMKVVGDVGAKSVVKKYGGRVLEVPVNDAGVLVDVDTPADYDMVRAGRSRRTRSRGGG